MSTEQKITFKRAHSRGVGCWRLPPAVRAPVNKRKLSQLSMRTNADCESTRNKRFDGTKPLLSLLVERQPTNASKLLSRRRVSFGKCPRALHQFMLGSRRKISSDSSSSSISMHSGELRNGRQPRLTVINKQELSRNGSSSVSGKQIKQRPRNSINWRRQGPLAQPPIQMLRLAHSHRAQVNSMTKRAQLKPSMSIDDDDYEDVEYKSDGENEVRSEEESQREDYDFLCYNDSNHHDRSIKSRSNNNQHHYQVDHYDARVSRKIATVSKPQMCPRAKLDEVFLR